jgi:hypothetical protein
MLAPMSTEHLPARPAAIYAEHLETLDGPDGPQREVIGRRLVATRNPSSGDGPPCARVFDYSLSPWIVRGRTAPTLAVWDGCDGILWSETRGILRVVVR